MTANLLQKVYDSLQEISNSNVPFVSLLRERIIAALARMAHPPLIPVNVNNTSIKPNVTSSWIPAEVEELWSDCLAAALFEKLSETNHEVIIATWPKDKTPSEILFSSEEICQILNLDNDRWVIPVATNIQDWNEHFVKTEDWPDNLDIYIEKYGRKNLGIDLNQLPNRRKIIFENACHHELAKESNHAFRNLIVEVIACRAYNQVKPEHYDETLEGQPGIRRVSVKRMNPPIRFHYYLGEDSVIYILYTNGDHDKGI